MSRKKKSSKNGAVAWTELDHALVEELRDSPKDRLTSITLRLGAEQISEARMVSEATGVPYQRILRKWIAIGAATAQQSRRKMHDRHRK